MKYSKRRMKRLINLVRVTELGTSKKNISELVVKSRTENLSLIRDFISSKASNAGISTEEIENIMLAVDEACENDRAKSFHSCWRGKMRVDHFAWRWNIIISIVD